MQDRARAFSLGLVLILAGWGVKHLAITFVAFYGGRALAEEAVRARTRADIADETHDLRLERERERLKDNPDRQRISDTSRKIDQASEQLNEDAAEDRVEAETTAKNAEAGMLSSFRWFLWLKVFDLAKIVGVFFVVWGTIGFVNDETVSTQLRWFGVAASTVVLAAVLVGGPLSFLS